jgi:hypothetical protein
MNAKPFARIAAIMALDAQTANAVVADPATTAPGSINTNSDPWD